MDIITIFMPKAVLLSQAKHLLPKLALQVASLKRRIPGSSVGAVIVRDRLPSVSPTSYWPHLLLSHAENKSRQGFASTEMSLLAHVTLPNGCVLICNKDAVLRDHWY